MLRERDADNLPARSSLARSHFAQEERLTIAGTTADCSPVDIRSRQLEALRDDEHFSYVAAWEYKGAGQPPVLNKEPLDFHYVHPSQRSYK